jgi:hypothetical protein
MIGLRDAECAVVRHRIASSGGELARAASQVGSTASGIADDCSTTATAAVAEGAGRARVLTETQQRPRTRRRPPAARWHTLRPAEVRPEPGRPWCAALGRRHRVTGQAISARMPGPEQSRRPAGLGAGPSCGTRLGRTEHRTAEEPRPRRQAERTGAHGAVLGTSEDARLLSAGLRRGGLLVVCWSRSARHSRIPALSRQLCLIGDAGPVTTCDICNVAQPQHANDLQFCSPDWTRTNNSAI